MRLLAGIVSLALFATSACKLTGKVVAYGVLGGALTTVGIVRYRESEDETDVGKSFGQGMIAVFVISIGGTLLAAAMLEGLIEDAKSRPVSRRPAKGQAGSPCESTDEDFLRGTCRGELVCLDRVCQPLSL